MDAGSSVDVIVYLKKDAAFFGFIVFFIAEIKLA